MEEKTLEDYVEAIITAQQDLISNRDIQDTELYEVKKTEYNEAVRLLHEFMKNRNFLKSFILLKKINFFTNNLVLATCVS